VAHCPVSNLKLASGIAPVAALQRAGVRIGLGSDGAASNNRLDLLREMNYASLLAKGSSGDAAALNAHDVLRMATLDGAAALGLDGRIGSLAIGKDADLCAVRLDDSHVFPCYDPLAHLVHVLGREYVSHVWVAGKPRVSEGELLDIDQLELLEVAKMWQNLTLDAA
jgi:5-methylthioadenosine/S-adenosylhomocysteine deaminase